LYMSVPDLSHKSALLISYHFPPCGSIGTQRTLRFVGQLPAFDWRPVILTARKQDFRTEPVEERWQEKVPATVPVYRARVLRPLEMALKLRRLWHRVKTGSETTQSGQSDGKCQIHVEAHGRSWVQRWIDPWFTTPDAQIGWLPFAIWRGMRVLYAERINLLYSSGPPYTSHLIGLILKRLSRRPWIVDFRDPWSRRPWDADTDRGGLRYRMQVRLERMVVQCADTIVSNTERMQEDFRQRYPSQPSDKFVVITNGYDPENFVDIAQVKGPPNDVFTITHAGSLYGRRDPRPLVHAMAQVRDENTLPNGVLRLNLIGNLETSFHLGSVVNSLKLQDWVAIIPPVPHTESLEYLMHSHLLLLLQPDAPLQIPGKLFEYLYLQKRILALTEEGSTADMVQRYNLGAVVEPRNTTEIAAVIWRFFQDFQNGKTCMCRSDIALRNFHGRTLTKQLATLFDMAMK
jgi:glycosyltransferase involved in cell wall biosynthesis